MRKKIIISVLVLLILSGTIYYFYPHKRLALPPHTDVWVKTVTLKPENFPLEVKTIGTLIAPNIKITPEVAGHVEKILFRDGEEVEENKVLVQLDASLERVKAQSTKAQLDYAKANYDRMTALTKRGAVSKKDLDEALSNLREKQSSAEENNVLVDKMQLRAPFSGFVGRSKVNIGEYLTVGQEVVTLTDNKHLRVEYNLPEQYRPSLQIGQEVLVSTPTYPNETFHAKLAYISPSINVLNRSTMLYAKIDDNDSKLVSGMFVNIYQSLGNDSNSILVPARSLVMGVGGEEIFRVIEGKAVATKVTLGKRTDRKVQILQGLKIGDSIITDGQEKVKNGDAIKISQDTQQNETAA